MCCVTENGGGGGESRVRSRACDIVLSCTVMRRVTENGSGGGGESRVRVTSCCHVASCVVLQRTAAVVVRGVCV